MLTLVGVDTALAAGRVRRGVRVSGIDLSGLHRAQARARLAASAHTVEAQQVTVRADTASLELPRSETGLRLDLDASVEAALAVGRAGPADPDRLRTWLSGVELPWRTRLDTSAFDRVVARADRQVRRPTTEPRLLVVAAQVRLVPGIPGQAVDRAGAVRVLAAAAARPTVNEISLPVTEQQPTVGPAAADAAAKQARDLLSAPVVVTAAGRQARLLPADLGPRVRTRVDRGRLVLSLDPRGLDALLRQKARFAYAVPRDAAFRPAGERIAVVPAVDGSVVDPGQAAAAVLAAGGRVGADRRAALPVRTSAPALTTAEARALGVKEVISSYTTTFNAGDAPRVHNISLIAAAVNGSLVLPDQVFSMNGATGQRTPSKGYRTAHVIRNGEIVDGIGGGVCQAGTTVFNAVFFAGLPVVERRNHSLHISHYPMGRDATLNWPGTDLKFRNDSPYGIYITAKATPATLKVTLYSTSRGYKVTHSTSSPYNFRAPQTRYEDDPTLPEGTEVVESQGSSGFDVTVHRTVTQSGRVVRKDTFVSNYIPWSKVVRRGTKKPDGPPTTLPRP
ncbi:MAG TPA: VanW family protein [Actinomycetes bacterium]|nr:VanW family protein [Actinomycetes bacterium]